MGSGDETSDTRPFSHERVGSGHETTFERGERGGASFGPAAVDGSKFPLSRWSQGHIQPPNSEDGAGFAFFAQYVDRSFGVVLQPFE